MSARPENIRSSKVRRIGVICVGVALAASPLAAGPLTAAQAASPGGAGSPRTNSGHAAAQATPTSFAATTQSKSFQTYAQPGSGDYLANTCLVDLSGIADLDPVSTITQCGQTITVSPTATRESVPDDWSTWGSPPDTESATPDILVNDGTSVTLTFSTPITYAGLEAEPDPVELHTFSSTYQSGGKTVGTVTRKDINGRAGAKLLAAHSTLPFDSITVSTDVDFAIAQIRVDTPDATSPIFAGYEGTVDSAKTIHSQVLDPYDPTCTIEGGHTAWLTSLGQYKALIESTCESGRIVHSAWAVGATESYQLPLTIDPKDRVSSAITAKGSKIVIKITDETTGKSATQRMAADGGPLSDVSVGLSSLDHAGQPLELGTFDPTSFSKVSVNKVTVPDLKLSRYALVDSGLDPLVVVQKGAVKGISFILHQQGTSPCKSGQIAGCYPACSISQLTTGSSNAIESQVWTTGDASLNAQAADDFTPTANCIVTTVWAPGTWSNYFHDGPPDHETITITDPTTPGNPNGPVVGGAPQNMIGTVSNANLTMTLPTPLTLSAGHTYWISVVPQQGPFTVFMWSWQITSTQTGSPGQWQNPNNGWATGCTTYTKIQTCYPTYTGSDVRFQLS